MWRFLLVLLVLCVGVSPFLPDLIKDGLKAAQGQMDEGRAAGTDATGSEQDYRRIHRVPSDHRGHFTLEARLNGRYVDMLLDTGATRTALPEAVAESIGIFLKPSDFKYSISTANGTTYAALTMIDSMRIGDIRMKDIDALVLKDDSLSEPLLGMSALNRLERFDISEGTLVLVQ